MTIAAPPSAPARLSWVAQRMLAWVVPSSSVTRWKPLITGEPVKERKESVPSVSTEMEEIFDSSDAGPAPGDAGLADAGAVSDG